MINKIINGIAAAIRDEFGEGYKIYVNEVKQDLEKPCFFVVLLSSERRRLVGRRFLCKNTFCIEYLPYEGGGEGKNEDCGEILPRLYRALEYISLDGDFLMGTQAEGELSDGSLSFFVNYNMTQYAERDKPELMRELKTKFESKD